MPSAELRRASVSEPAFLTGRIRSITRKSGNGSSYDWADRGILSSAVTDAALDGTWPPRPPPVTPEYSAKEACTPAGPAVPRCDHQGRHALPRRPRPRRPCGIRRRRAARGDRGAEAAAGQRGGRRRQPALLRLRVREPRRRGRPPARGPAGGARAGGRGGLPPPRAAARQDRPPGVHHGLAADPDRGAAGRRAGSRARRATEPAHAAARPAHRRAGRATMAG